MQPSPPRRPAHPYDHDEQLRAAIGALTVSRLEMMPRRQWLTTLDRS